MAAEQRNASAVSYHFGSRDGLLRAVLARRGGPIDAERGRLRDLLGPQATVAELVSCLVEPWADSLLNAEGRAYLRIVDQLRGRFARWRTESDPATTVHLVRILDELETRAVADGVAIGRERVVAMIVLLTGLAADRARRIDDGDEVGLDHQGFLDSLVDMCGAVISSARTAAHR